MRFRSYGATYKSRLEAEEDALKDDGIGTASEFCLEWLSYIASSLVEPGGTSPKGTKEPGPAYCLLFLGAF